MGVDIYGRNPKISSPKPEINFETASEAERDGYFKIIYDWEEENPGYYFRSNWWGWRPIVIFTETACALSNIDVDLEDWHTNSGEGPETQEQCNEIADAIESLISQNGCPIKEDDDILYLVTGCWCTNEGKFVDKAVEEKLNKEYPFGSVLTQGVITESGELVRSAHGCSLERIKEFIQFLRNCGGFQVY